VADEAAGLLRRAGLVPLPPVFTSVLANEGIEALGQSLARLMEGQAQKPAEGLAFLPVDRAFAIPGHGPVVTGTLRGAAVAAGEVLELFPARKAVRVRAAQVRGARVEGAAPGQRVALNLRDVELAELARGMALAAPGWLAPSDWLTISVRAVADAPPLKNGMQLRALLGTEEIGVRLRLLDADALEPGQSGFAQLHCASPVAFPAREHVVLRLASPAQTVAGGRILAPQTKRLRRHSPPVLARLAKLRDLAPETLLLAEIEAQGAVGTSLARLSQLSALAPAHIAEALRAQPVLVARGGLVVARAALDALAGRIPPLLAARPDGLPAGRLLAALPGTGADVLDEAVAQLLARNAIVRRGALLSLPQPEADRARAAGEADLAVQITALLRAGGLAPPDPRTIVTSLAAKRAVDRLLREGILIRAVDRAKNKEILFHFEAVEAAIRRLEPLLVPPPGLLATDVGAALGISRKYSIPLLDHMDTIRFTKRVNDRRIRGTASLTVLLSAATNG